MGLGTAAAMWTYLCQRYQPSGDALYLSVVRQEHDLQQGDSTVDEFYTQSSAIWRQLDSLRTVVCGTCRCCQTVRSDLEFQRVHEFLSRLRPEFEPRRAHLLARGRRVPISEVLSELRAEETRLRSAGLLVVPTVLAARAPMSSAPPLLPTPSRGWVDGPLQGGVGLALTCSATTARSRATQSPPVSRRTVTWLAPLQWVVRLHRARHSLIRTLCGSSGCWLPRALPQALPRLAPLPR